MVPPVTLRDRVRAATRPEHERLERQLALATRPWTLAAYVAFLQSTLAVAHALEPAIDRFAGVVFGDPRRAGLSVERLRHDLRAVAAADGPAAPPGQLPPISTPAQAFGAAYVFEGSQLGGQLIARAIEAELDLPGAAMTYLRPPGGSPGARWRAFVQQLDAFGAADPAAADAVIDTARATFVSFEQAFAARGLR